MPRRRSSARADRSALGSSRTACSDRPRRPTATAAFDDLAAVTGLTISRPPIRSAEPHKSLDPETITAPVTGIVGSATSVAQLVLDWRARHRSDGSLAHTERNVPNGNRSPMQNTILSRLDVTPPTGWDDRSQLIFTSPVGETPLRPLGAARPTKRQSLRSNGTPAGSARRNPAEVPLERRPTPTDRISATHTRRSRRPSIAGPSRQTGTSAGSADERRELGA